MSDWSFGSLMPSGEQGPGPGPELTTPTAIEGANGLYRILETLGEGGAGRVFRALDPIGRQVAVKLLRRAGDPEDVERFTREGRMAAAVQHPNVITVHEIGEHAGHPFLVYELVEEDLSFAQALRDYDRDDRLDLLAQVIDGVAAAHRQGLVHRDLKPENILLGRDGRPRVTDFGLGLGEQDQRLTQSGALLGTPRVMAPEQVRSERERQGPATDVWSLGVMLYQALTDRAPFDAVTLTELVAQVTAAEPPAPRRLDPTIAPALERVCLRALAKRPEDRYSDAGELGRALLAARRERPRGRLVPLAAAGALLALTLGAVAAWSIRAPEPRAVPEPGARPADPLATALAEVDRVYKAKRYARSLQLVRAILKEHPRSLEANLNEGEILCQLERWADAIEAFDRARKLDPDNLRALTASGAAKGKLGRHAEGLAELNRALEIDPKHADALEKRALVNYERHAYRAALDDAERALEIQPKSAEGRNFRGLARAALGDLKGALEDFHAAYALDPNPDVLSNIGTIRLDLGQRERGLADLRRSLGLKPEQPAAWVSIAIDHYKRKEYAESLKTFERALKIQPNDPWARFGRATALFHLRRYPEARAEAQWVLDEHPQHPQAEQARRLLRNLKRRSRTAPP